ncbi:rare lipoprotein A [Spirochaeta africana DSM 8902]|uniref:Probable endolytic peptidoglycan transglycosylase RlpA n=2 Tax=Spirochaeta TaxID=146 RepID=H9UGB5_SPIAZ|nr:rare lipoprotein A [Spirochaeta africana DSM 8902]
MPLFACGLVCIVLSSGVVTAVAAETSAAAAEQPEIAPRLSAPRTFQPRSAAEQVLPLPDGAAAHAAAASATEGGSDDPVAVSADALPMDDPQLADHELEGIASWYGGKFQGRLTANGERFDTNEMTAAHKTLPFNSIVRVVNLNNGKQAELRINDRGPFVEGRVIDLSRAGAEAIGMSGTGIAPVRVEVLHYQQESPYRILQIGSFGDLDNAEQLVIELSNAGLSPSIESTDSGLHRVLVAQVHTDHLDETRARLAQLGYPDVLVRRVRD